jgi:hypothetical protein
MRASVSLGREFSWKPPLIAALIVLCTAGPLLWGRDFGLFFLLIPYALGLGGICLFGLVVGIFAKEPGARPTYVVTSLIAAAMFVLLYFTAAPTSFLLHNRLGFEIWYATHGKVADKYRKQDAIIMTWDDWGFAGMSFFSFLISDPDDSIGGSTDRASAWARRLKSDCEVTDVTRLRRGLYILSTYNCPLGDEREESSSGTR